jgi:hypothetical protein
MADQCRITDAGMSRRSLIGAGAAATAMIAAGPALSAAPKLGSTKLKSNCRVPGGSKIGLTGPHLDLTTPEGNVEAFARINGDIDQAATSYSWYTGRVSGQRPGEAARDLMRIIGMGTVRMLPLQGRAGYQMLRKELGFFVDLETGAVLDRWTNPYSNEEVTVDHIANPSINVEIKPYIGETGLYEEVNPEKARPFVLDWTIVGDRAITERHANLWVKNPLDPEVWKRESSGPMIAISDSNVFNVSLADLQNLELTKVPSQGHWVHQRPWQPWMLMGQEEGFISYNCVTGSAGCLNDLPAQIVELARGRFPDFLEAPTEVTKAESSLARYIRTRKPAPARAEEK